MELTDGIDVHTALTELRHLEDEDPQLRYGTNSCRKFTFQVMGEVQLEVLKRIIKRFGIDIEFSHGGTAGVS